MVNKRVIEKPWKYAAYPDMRLSTIFPKWEKWSILARVPLATER